MTALAADKNILSRKETTLTSYPVDVAAVIYKGALVCIDTDGFARAGADTAGFRCAGVADEAVSGVTADGTRKVNVLSGRDFLLTGANLSQAMVGDAVFLDDDGTVNTSANTVNGIFVGILVEYVSATSGWVRIPDDVARAGVGATAWAITSFTEDKGFAGDSTTAADAVKAIASLVNELILKGIIHGSVAA